MLKSPTRAQDDYAGLAFVIAGKRAADEKLWNDTLVWNAEAAKSEVRAGTGVIHAPPAAASTSSLGPCGGDLPPCYVKARESGGDYKAYNPTGCGGRGCFGAWQFSGAWAGKLGLPDDLSQATPEQQDNAARQLYAGGAGCSNWGC